MKLWVDLETRSSVPIKKGIAKYATDVEIIMAQWAIDDGEVHVEDVLADELSEELQQAIRDADEIWAHGAEFEQTMFLVTRWTRKLNIPPSKWR
jgi:hypothetical protein